MSSVDPLSAPAVAAGTGRVNAERLDSVLREIVAKINEVNASVGETRIATNGLADSVVRWRTFSADAILRLKDIIAVLVSLRRQFSNPDLTIPLVPSVDETAVQELGHTWAKQAATPASTSFAVTLHGQPYRRYRIRARVRSVLPRTPVASPAGGHLPLVTPVGSPLSGQPSPEITPGPPPTITGPTTLALSLSYPQDAGAILAIGAVWYGLDSDPSGSLYVDVNAGAISYYGYTEGTYDVVFSATNTNGTTLRHCALSLGFAPEVTSSLSVSGPAGSPFSYQITASRSPTSFEARNLPSGLTLNPATGVISGTPTYIGYYYPEVRGINVFSGPNVGWSPVQIHVISTGTVQVYSYGTTAFHFQHISAFGDNPNVISTPNGSGTLVQRIVNDEGSGVPADIHVTVTNNGNAPMRFEVSFGGTFDVAVGATQEVDHWTGSSWSYRDYTIDVSPVPPP